MTEESPTIEISLNGVPAEDYFIRLEARRAVTSQVGSFQLDLSDDKFTQWSALASPQPVLITVDDTLIFKGRIDSTKRHWNKKDGYITTVTGRDMAGALQDTIISTYYSSEVPANIFIDQLTQYNARRLSGDSGFDYNYNDFTYVPLPFTNLKWNRNSVWKNIGELCNMATGSFANDPMFFDFWAEPDLTDPNNTYLYLVETGSLDSGLDFGAIGGKYIKDRTGIEDSLPVKNDVWVWGEQSSGKVPLRFQQGWGSRQVPVQSWESSWTKNAASHFIAASNMSVLTGNVLSNSSDHDAITDVAGCLEVRTISIMASLSGWLVGDFKDRSGIGYISMPFDSTSYPSVPWVDICQPRYLNAYNETGMAETNGEFSAVNFYAKSDSDLTMWIEVADNADPPNLIDSPEIYIKGGCASGITLNSSTDLHWQGFSIPFGPSATGYYYQRGTTFDWGNVTEVRIMFTPSSFTVATLQWWLSSLCFIKPLVANSVDSTATTRRTDIRLAPSKNTYQLARMLADGIRRTEDQPQRYYDYVLYGRPDVPIGQKAKFEGKNLLIRELAHLITKDAGYTTTVKAFEAV